MSEFSMTRRHVATQLAGGALRRLASIPIASRPLLTITRNGWMPKRIVKSLPTSEPFEVQLEESGSFYYVPSHLDHIGSLLYWGGMQSFEPETIPVFCQLARHSRMLIDVGANTGFYSLIACAANPSLRVSSFEPVPRVFELLKANILYNEYERRCEIRRCALGATIGKAEFHVPFSSVPTSGSLNLNGHRGLPGNRIAVGITTLDSEFADAESVDLIKIDVEGFEHEVLHGAKTLISKHRPPLILECNPNGPAEQITEQLRPLSYRFFHLRSEGLVEMSEIKPGSRRKFKNFLCATDLSPELEDCLVPRA